MTPSQHYLPSLQEIALSSRPLEVEVAFERPPRHDFTFDGTVTPVGVSGSIRRFQVLDHPHVERIVDRVAPDKDLSAAEGCTILCEANVDVYRISQLLTSSLLGRRRQLVPTRWAITATDDIVFSGMRPRLLCSSSLDHIQMFSATLLGNTIIYLFVPGDWSFEMIEIWGKRSLWGGGGDEILSDRERKKRTTYSPISSTYYAARLVVSEYLTHTEPHSTGAGRAERFGGLLGIIRRPGDQGSNEKGSSGKSDIIRYYRFCRRGHLLSPLFNPMGTL